MWKSRSLTPYGKTTVLKSLALPKILYFTSMVDVPSRFLQKVKTLRSKFLWSGRNPKVKYQTIIGQKIKGCNRPVLPPCPLLPRGKSSLG